MKQITSRPYYIKNSYFIDYLSFYNQLFDDSKSAVWSDIINLYLVHETVHFTSYVIGSRHVVIIKFVAMV